MQNLLHPPVSDNENRQGKELLKSTRDFKNDLK